MKISFNAQKVVVEILADDNSVIMAYSTNDYAVTLDINKLIAEAGGIAQLMQDIERKFVEAARTKINPERTREEPAMTKEEAIDTLMAMTFGTRTGRTSRAS